MPFELSNFKSTQNEFSESFSYEMPSSTPEFIESPLTSASKPNPKKKVSINDAASALSTFKRIADSNLLAHNESSID